jgi:hypothetical protein
LRRRRRLCTTCDVEPGRTSERALCRLPDYGGRRRAIGLDLIASAFEWLAAAEDN